MTEPSTIDFSQFTHFPKVIVFDLDYTLWPAYIDFLSGPPFTITGSHGHIVRDPHANEVKLFDEVPAILHALKEYADTHPHRLLNIAIASRSPATEWAHHIVSSLKVPHPDHHSDPTSSPTTAPPLKAMRHFFGQIEIYPTEKTKHFQAITTANRIGHADCLFFDDEGRNIRDLSKVGVTCVHIKQDGMNWKYLQRGLAEYSSKRGSQGLMKNWLAGAKLNSKSVKAADGNMDELGYDKVHEYEYVEGDACHERICYCQQLLDAVGANIVGLRLGFTITCHVTYERVNHHPEQAAAFDLLTYAGRRSDVNKAASLGPSDTQRSTEDDLEEDDLASKSTRDGSRLVGPASSPAGGEPPLSAPPPSTPSPSSTSRSKSPLPPRSPPPPHSNPSPISLKPILDHLTPSYHLNSDIQTDITNPLTYPYPIPETSLRTFRYQTALQLSPFAYRNLVLTCPHPGATSYLEETVKGVAKMEGADVFLLEYMDILRAVDEVTKQRLKRERATEVAAAAEAAAAAANRNTFDSNASASSSSTSSDNVIPTEPPLALRRSYQHIQLAPSFNPTLYEPVSNSFFMSEEEDDDLLEDDLEDDADDDVDFGPRGEGGARKSMQHVFPVTVRLVINPDSNSGVSGNSNGGSRMNGPVSLGGIAPKFAPGGMTLNSSVGSDGTDSKGMITNSNGKRVPSSFYSSAIKPADLEVVLQSIFTMLRQKLKPTPDRPQPKVIIYYKDITDTMEAAKDHGKRLLAGLLDIVQSLRKTDKTPCVLIAGATPSLLDSPSDLKKFYAPDLLKKIYSSRVVPRSRSPPGSQMLASEGMLFRSCLDNMKRDFENVCFPPPSPSVLTPPTSLAPSPSTSFTTIAAVSTTTTKEQPDTLETPSTTTPDALYDDWLKQMQTALQTRYRELNWLSIERMCKALNVHIRGLTLSDVLHPSSDRNQVPASMERLLEALDAGVWSQERVRSLVSLAIGYRLTLMVERGTPTGRDQGGRVELGVREFEEAFRLETSDVVGGLIKDGEGLERRKEGVEEDEEEEGEDEGGEGLVVPATLGKDVGGVSEGKGVTAGEEVEKPKTTTTSTPPKASVVNVLEAREAEMESLKKQLARKGFKLTSYEKKLLSTVVPPSTIPVSFSDLVLPPSTKLTLQSIVTLPLLRPDLFNSGVLSKHSISGVLLFGPPGTGKTLLAKAVAKSSGARFMSVSLSDIFDKYVGEGEKNVKAVFNLARKIAPSVVFLDEVDAIFGRRGTADAGNSSRREIINEFMSEWDGLTSANQGVVVLGATNRPFDLDDAILRRMPRRVLVDLPNEAQRRQILEVHLKDEVLDSSVSLDDLARQTHLYSGSDIKNVCVAAALASVKEVIYKENIAKIESVNVELEKISTEEALAKLESVEDWSSFSSKALLQPLAASAKNRHQRVLTKAHFEIGLKEVPPSLTDEAQTMVELKKWDDLYGEGAAKRKGVKRVSKGILVPVIIFTWDPDKTLRANYFFAQKVYLFAFLVSVIVGAIMSFLLNVSQLSRRSLAFENLNEIFAHPQSFLALGYISLAFPILKVLIIRVHHQSPVFKDKATGSPCEYIGAIRMKLKLTFGYRTLIGACEMAILYRMTKFSAFITAFLFTRLVDSLRRIYYEKKFLRAIRKQRASVMPAVSDKGDVQHEKEEEEHKLETVATDVMKAENAPIEESVHGSMETEAGFFARPETVPEFSKLLRRATTIRILDEKDNESRKLSQPLSSLPVLSEQPIPISEMPEADRSNKTEDNPTSPSTTSIDTICHAFLSSRPNAHYGKNKKDPQQETKTSVTGAVQDILLVRASTLEATTKLAHFLEPSVAFGVEMWIVGVHRVRLELASRGRPDLLAFYDKLVECRQLLRELFLLDRPS
ncbi:hypothetical protein HDV05_002847 [Chytridiales sp. JEL 0842]|nr:hypothetical protein HDV05_002847 [Chytridiales sp. JEL 0842]